MKVLQIETIYSTGGISQIVLSLMDALEANGDDCRFAFGRLRMEVDPERQDKVFRMENNGEIVMHAVKSRLFDAAALGSTLATERLIGYIKSYDPDLIQLHSLLGHYINIKVLFSYLATAGKPVVWTQHDCWAFTGHCIHFVTANCDKWKTGCSHCPLIHTYPESLFLDRSAHNYALKKQLFTSVPNMTLVVPSEWLGRLVRESFLGKYPIRVIPNGIDLKLYHTTENDVRERYRIGNKKIILGVAGVWSPTKGLHFLTEMYQKLDHSKYQLVIIGANDEQIAAMPEGTIAFKRTTNVNELIAWYSAADVFINPTLADNFPTVNLEALACGTPVITFPTGGSVESVDETCGIVTEEKTADGILAALARMEEHPFTAEACLERSKRYDCNARYLDYIRLYHEIIEKSETTKK